MGLCIYSPYFRIVSYIVSMLVKGWKSAVFSLVSLAKIHVTNMPHVTNFLNNSCL